jgi:hypothetical protein
LFVVCFSCTTPQKSNMSSEEPELDLDIRNQSGDYYSSDEDGDLFDSPRECQPPVSPAKGAESLFLAGLTTAQISAEALAKRLRKGSSSKLSSGYSAQSEDFLTAAGTVDDLDYDSSDEDEILGKDALLYSRISEIDSVCSSIAPEKVTSAKKMPTSTSQEPHPDVTTHVYEGAKGVWAWGKGVPVVSLGLGIAEAVASKAVSVVGTDFEEIDANIKPNLAGFDKDVLNPTIAKLVEILMGTKGKTEDIIKPIIHALMHPMTLIKKEPENPEVTAPKPVLN